MKSRRRISKIKTLAIMFVVYNILWLFNYTAKYGGYAETVEYNYAVRTYHETNKEMDITYGVMMPSYPSFTSFLYINYDYYDEHYNIYIYPNLISGYKIGFVHNNSNGELVDEIWFDENMKLLDKYKSTATIEEYRKEIDKLCDLVYEKWGIWIYDGK